MSPIGKKSDAIDKPVEIPEWRKKLSATRRPKSVVISESPIVEEAVDQVPSFMKEFEKKKKNRSRGNCWLTLWTFDKRILQIFYRNFTSRIGPHSLQTIRLLDSQPVFEMHGS